MTRCRRLTSAALGAAALLSLTPSLLHAHCDTLDGPVVMDAKKALDAGDITPVLKWVAPEKEAELRSAFEHVVKVRALGEEARTLADRFFFETLVRVHREGEGAPFTGLKPAGTEVDPAIAESDRALETGSVDPLVGMIAAQIEEGLRERFAHAREAKARAEETVESGRAYVAAYVEFMHYAERLRQAATSPSAHPGHEAASAVGGAEAHRH